MNKLLLIALLFSFVGFSADDADDADDSGESEFVILEQNSDKDGESGNKSNTHDVILSKNEGRGFLSGTIKFGTVEYNVNLYNRRDVLSQALSTMGGQPSHYTRTKKSTLKNGLETTYKPERGRLKTEICDDFYRLIFCIPATDNNDYNRNLEPENYLYVVYVPLKDFFDTVNSSGKALKTTVMRKNEDVKPEGENGIFYVHNVKVGSPEDIDSIELELVFTEEYMSSEAGKALSHAAQATWNNLKSAANIISGGFWSAWNYVSSNGALNTLADGVETFATVANVLDGGARAYDALARGGVVGAAKEALENRKEVQGVLNNTQTLANQAEKLIEGSHQINLENERAVAQQKVNEVELVVADLQQQRHNCEETITEFAREKIEAAEEQVQLQEIEAQLKLRTIELEIAQLELNLIGADEQSKMKITAKIVAKKKLLEKLQTK